MKLLTHTDAEFDQLSWHDNPLYGFHLDRDDESKSDLIFDIDFITEWLCDTDKTCQFMIAAATLRFHDVTDLKINLDWGDTKFQVIVNEFSIASIDRERIIDQRICLDRPYYTWSINGKLPFGTGSISFGASGFTQVLRQEPILCQEQKLPSNKRAKLISAG